jgi:hypothetical protein
MIVGFDSIKNMIPFSRSRIKIELNPTQSKDAETLVSVERSSGLKRGWINKVLRIFYHLFYSLLRGYWFKAKSLIKLTAVEEVISV